MTAPMMTIVGLPASRSPSANDRSTGFVLDATIAGH